MKKIIFIALLSIGTLAHSQSTRDKLSQLVNGPEGFKSKYLSNGICIGIIQDDSTYYFSLGKTAQGTALTENTVFEIASVTKTFTGLLLGLEIEKKHIGKDDLIDRYLPKGVQL